MNTTNTKGALVALIADLRTLHSRATPGKWQKGQTTHHTVSRLGESPPYRVAEFRHADDAAFCDAAHEHLPAILEAFATALQAHSPPAPAKPEAWAVYWGIGQMRKNSVHIEKATADEVASAIKSHTEVRPLYGASKLASETAAGAVTDAMVLAYLDAQRAAVEEADKFGRPNIGGLHTNTVREACRAGIAAALAATPPADPYATYGKRSECDKPILKGRAAIVDAWNSLDHATRTLPGLDALYRACMKCEDATPPAATKVPKKPSAEALEALMANHGNAEDLYVASARDLNCPHCGGSGHIDDCSPAAHGATTRETADLKEWIAANSPGGWIDDLRGDAARYRVLRRGQHWSVIDGIGDALRAEALDAAIDSARKVTPPSAQQEGAV